jgi:conjugal transfer ATP-binding protein TraC
MPQIRDQSREWEYMSRTQLRQGQKLVRAYSTVSQAFSTGLARAMSNERSLKAVYKACGWELQDERRYMQMFGLACRHADGTFPNGLVA